MLGMAKVPELLKTVKTQETGGQKRREEERGHQNALVWRRNHVSLKEGLQ